MAIVGGIGADAALQAVGEPLAAIARAAGDDSAARTEEDPISHFESMGAGYTTLYWTLPPAQLLPQVEAHIQAGRELIRAQSNPAERARAAAALAEVQLLAGRLRSHELSPILGWLESVRAEVGAIGGDVEASRAAIAKAEEFLDRGGRVPRWFDWFNGPRLGSFAGYCLLRSAQALPKGATERSRLALEARDGLLRALRGLDGTFAAKQQGVVLADLARAHAELGDMPEACSTSSAAGAAVRVTGYAMARPRVRVVHDALRQRWGREPMVRGLDDLLPI